MIDKPLDYIIIDEGNFIEATRKETMEPNEYPQETESVEVKTAEAELPVEVLDTKEALMQAFWDDAKSQGIYEDIKKAIQEHPDVYLGSIRDKVYAFRPLYWDERVEIQESIRSGDMKLFTEEELVRRCVVVGLDKIIGKRARAGIWEALAQRINEVSDYDTDLPPNANPPAVD